MTKKENLLIRAVAAENEIAVLTGKAQFIFKSDDHRRNLADATTAYELEQRIKRAERNLEAAKQQAKLDAFYATEEGKAFKAKCEARLNELEETRSLILDATGSRCQALIQEQLGKGWDINFDEGRIEIGLLSDDESNRKFIFGHTFELRYKYDYDYIANEIKFILEMNYGTMGGFDLLTDKKRTEFIIGLGKVTDPDLIDDLKGILQDLTDCLEANRKENRRIKDFLKNPF